MTTINKTEPVAFWHQGEALVEVFYNATSKLYEVFVAGEFSVSDAKLSNLTGESKELLKFVKEF